MRIEAVTTSRGNSQPHTAARSSGLRTRTLYVGGFGSDTTAQELRALFDRHGQVEDLRLVSRGEASFAYVTFADDADATHARLNLDGTTLAGRTLRVAVAQ